MAIKRARELVDIVINELEWLTWFHKLLDIANEQEQLEDIQVLLEAYIPIGKAHLENIENRLEDLQNELSAKKKLMLKNIEIEVEVRFSI